MMPRRVLVLGSTGMLGHALVDVLSSRGHRVVRAARAYEYDVHFDANHMYQNYFGQEQNYLDEFLRRVGPVDWVINAIGVTPRQRAYGNEPLTFFVNGALPQILANRFGNKLIHITTDCVYNGTTNLVGYCELRKKSPVDLYGLTKSLGEPESCITIRTSIIGRERFGFFGGLLEWFLSQKPNAKVDGWINHYWNGITTYEFARLCQKLITETAGDFCGVYHVFSETVSKYKMLQAFQERYRTKIQIEPVANPKACDRRLNTYKDLNQWFSPKSFHQMIYELP